MIFSGSRISNDIFCNRVEGMKVQLTDPIDVHEFLLCGHIRSKVPEPVANALLRRLDCLEYRDMPADHCDAGPRYRGVLEQDGAALSLLNALWGKILAQDLGALTKLFSANPERSVITVIRLGSGYELDWHNHLAAGPTATLLVYLFSQKHPGEGGDLVIGHLDESLTRCGETFRYSIGHGDAILIGDMTHPLLQHRADRWQGEGWRYLISFAFNASDW